jgi:hypothetical protein
MIIAPRQPGKKYPEFKTFGEYFYWAYANLNLFEAAIDMGKSKKDKSCYAVRAKAFKAYKEGRWHIHDLLKNNVAKIQNPDVCWYCGAKVSSPKELTIDHIIPRSKGGDNSMDNIFMVCKSCNSSKHDMDVLEWFFIKKNQWPPIEVIAHYLKQIYNYATTNELMDKALEEVAAMDLPFNPDYFPIDYPHPEEYNNQITNTI